MLTFYCNMFARTLLLFAIVASTSAAFDTSCNAVKSSFSENVCAPGDAPYEHFDATSATEYHDLDDTTIDFIPCSSTTYAFETRNATATNKADAEATTGVEANIGDDECAHITIQTFDYFGSSYGNVFLCSNGYLTFEDYNSASAFVSQFQLKKMISANWNDYDPSSGGAIYHETVGSLEKFRWHMVPEYGTSNKNSFMIVLDTSNGIISITHNTIASDTGIVGLSSGGGASSINQVDFKGSAAGSADYCNAPTYSPTSLPTTAPTDGYSSFNAQCDNLRNEFGHFHATVCAPPNAPYEIFTPGQADTDISTADWHNHHDLDDTTITFMGCGNGAYAFETSTATDEEKADAVATSGFEWNAGDDTCIEREIQPFQYFGEEYTALHFCTNGHLSFSGNNEDFTESVAEFQQHKMIAAIWDDHHPMASKANDQLYHDTVGAVEKFRWHMVPQYNDTPGTSSFMVALDTSTGRITITHGTIITTDGIVGLSNGDGDLSPVDFKNDAGHGSYCATPTGIACSVTCYVDARHIVRVNHTTTSQHSHHRCFDNGSGCTCVCGN
jgi:hypothetical protein